MSVDSLLQFCKRLIPKKMFSLLQPLYHILLSISGAILYRFPAKNIIVVGVTGTKGKSSTLEMLNSIFEHAGYKTALLSTIRFKIGASSEPNLRKMTIPGRFFVQRFLRRAVREHCDIVFLELTSEGAKQKRHWFLSLNALVFTNLQKEHIEAHGSFENYAASKLSIGKSLARSKKYPRTIVANADDAYGKKFLQLPVEQSLPFSLKQNKEHSVSEKGISFAFKGTAIRSSLPGEFSLYNALAAATLADAFGISPSTIAEGLSSLTTVPGRAENIDCGQSFSVIVDYAHTTDSLTAIYDAYDARRKICVLGSTGGGRDTWKRPEMGKIAEERCSHVILTNEDPYDEDPEKIVREIASGMNKSPDIIMDRRSAIERAVSLAKEGDAVIITGKGTDPFIMGPNGSKERWSDASVAREVLTKVMGK